MSTRNIRTAEYKSYNDPLVAGLKLTPTAYGIPSASSVVLTDESSATVISLNQPIIPTLATASSTPATTAVAGAVDTLSVGKWLRIDHEFDSTYNIGTGFPRHTILMGVQSGNGKISFDCPAGHINTVVNYRHKTRAKGAVFALIHLGSNVWDIMGDLEKL